MTNVSGVRFARVYQLDKQPPKGWARPGSERGFLFTLSQRSCDDTNPGNGDVLWVERDSGPQNFWTWLRAATLTGLNGLHSEPKGLLSFLGQVMLGFVANPMGRLQRLENELLEDVTPLAVE